MGRPRQKNLTARQSYHRTGRKLFSFCKLWMLTLLCISSLFAFFWGEAVVFHFALCLTFTLIYQSSLWLLVSGSSRHEAVPQGKGPGAEGDRQDCALTNQGTTVGTLPAPESKTMSQISRESIWEHQEMVPHMPQVCPGDKVTYSLYPESICEAQSASHYRRGQDMPQNSSKRQLEISPELNWSSWSHEGA